VYLMGLFSFDFGCDFDSIVDFSAEISK